MIILIFAAGIFCGFFVCRREKDRKIARLEKAIANQRETMFALSKSLVNANLKSMALTKLSLPEKPPLAETKCGHRLARFSEN